MNYNSFRTAIANAIDSNGVKAITGKILQDAILSVVDALDLGALYLGEATTTTRPSSEANGFYLALQTGTYTHFQISVAKGEVALIVKTDSRWKKQVLTVMPYIDPVSKHWIVNGEDSGVLAEGQQGQPGQNAVTPFKGWYDPDEIPTTGQEGDYCYVTDNGTTKVWKWNPDAEPPAFEETADTPDTDHTQTFASAESVNQVAIDKSELVNPVNPADPTKPVLAKAEDVMQLKAKLDGVTASETKVATIEDWHPDGSSRGYYNNGNWQTNDNFKSIRVDVSGCNTVRFLGYNHHFNTFTPQYVFFNDSNNPIGGYHEYYDSTMEDGKNVELIVSVPNGAKYFVCLYKAYYGSSGTTYLDESKFYIYLIKGENVVDLINKSKVQVVDNLNTADADKALSAKQGKELADAIFGETVTIEDEVNFNSVSTKVGQLLAGKIAGSSDGENARIWVVPVTKGDTLQIQAQSDKAVYLCILNSNPTIPSNGISAANIPIANNCEGYIPTGSGNYRMVIDANEKATIKIASNSDAKYVFINKLFQSSTSPFTPQSFVIEKEKREGGIIEQTNLQNGFYLKVEHGNLDDNGQVVQDDKRAVTNFINNGKGFYIELREGYQIERAMLFDNNGMLLSENFYVHNTSGHQNTDANCWGSNNRLSQFLVRVVIKKDDEGDVDLNGLVKKFVYLNDSRLSRVIPIDNNFIDFLTKVNQLTNIVWKALEKAEHNNGGGINRTLWFLKDSTVIGVPYSGVGEYSKFIGIDVAFRTFLTATKNRRSVVYTEMIEGATNISKYGLNYHGETNFSGNFFGSICTGLYSYILGHKICDYVADLPSAIGANKKIAYGAKDENEKPIIKLKNSGGTYETVTIDELFANLQPMDMVWNTGHISMFSDLYRDEFGRNQYIVWTEQTGPCGRNIPYSKVNLKKRLDYLITSGKDWSIYRLTNSDWQNAFINSYEDTSGYIQNMFFDFEPTELEIDPDITTFEGEYAVFVVNSNSTDATDSYNNYKAFLNIHRDKGKYTTLQIFDENADVDNDAPVQSVDISTTSNNWIVKDNQSNQAIIYSDDTADKDDWIIVDLMQLSPKLSAGKYKARVVNYTEGSEAESGFTHFQIAEISFILRKSETDNTKVGIASFNVEGGTPVMIVKQGVFGVTSKDDQVVLDSSDVESQRKDLSGESWSISSTFHPYVKIIVRCDYGTAVKRINLNSYWS